MSRRYAIVIEQGPDSYGAHVPDLPGCVAAAQSREEVLQLIREAINFHLETLRESGEPIPEPLPKRSTWRFSVRLLLIAFLAPALLHAAELPKELRGRFPAKIEKQLLAIQAKGEPLLWRQLNDWVPQVPNKQNAQIPIERAIDAMQDNDFFSHYSVYQKAWFGLKVRRQRDPIPPKLLPFIKRLVESQKGTLRLIHAAAKFPQYRSAINYNLGVKAINPQMTQMTSFVRLLGHEAQWRAHQKQASAADSLLAQLAIIRHLDNEPALISKLLQQTFHGITLTPTCHVLSRDVLTEPQLAALQKAHASMDHTSSFPRTIAYERTMLMKFFFHAPDVIKKEEEKFIEMFSFGIEWKEVDEALKRRTPRDRHHDLAFFLESFSRYQAISRLPFPQQLQAAEKFDQAIMKKMGDRNDPDAPALSEYLISQQAMYFTIGKRISVRLANAQTYGAIAQTAFAIERYRRANQGKLPKTLNDLTPKFLKTVPADPFTGKPVRFLKKKNEYRVYSVARDQKDNGGSSRRVNGQYDIIMRIVH